jgi:hypothetical protein
LETQNKADAEALLFDQSEPKTTAFDLLDDVQQKSSNETDKLGNIDFFYSGKLEPMPANEDSTPLISQINELYKQSNVPISSLSKQDDEPPSDILKPTIPQVLLETKQKEEENVKEDESNEKKPINFIPEVKASGANFWESLYNPKPSAEPSTQPTNTNSNEPEQFDVFSKPAEFEYQPAYFTQPRNQPPPNPKNKQKEKEQELFNFIQLA